MESEDSAIEYLEYENLTEIQDSFASIVELINSES